MIICGIKASHDGAVAVVEDGSLRFSVETEKLSNGERYSSLGGLQQVTDVLADEGLSPGDVDQFVVDGWYTRDASGAHAVSIGAGERVVERGRALRGRSWRRRTTAAAHLHRSGPPGREAVATPASPT
mgnify:CR=1 FL=1